MEEIWKDVKGFEGRYMVSNAGKVKSLAGIYFRGMIPIKKKGVILKPGLATKGYFTVNIGRYNSKYIHRLVAMAFIPNPENKTFINHINSNRQDNRMENLEWCTPLENSRHCIASGRHRTTPRFGAKNHKSKTVKDTLSGVEYECVREAAKAIGINTAALQKRIKVGRQNRFIYA